MRLTITAILLLSCVNTVAAEVLTSTTQPHSDTKVQPLPVSYTHLTLPTNREV